MRTFKIATIAIALAGCAIDNDTTEPTAPTDQLTTAVHDKLALPANTDVVQHHRIAVTDKIDHVRYRQTYRGVPVLHGGATAVVENGVVTKVLDHTDKDIDLDVVPTVSKEDVIQRALADHGPDANAQASAELVIDRDQQKVVNRTRTDGSAVNRDEVSFVTTRHVLTWQVYVSFGHEAMLYVYDAHSGELRAKRDPGSHSNTTVPGVSFYEGTRQIDVKTGGACGTFYMSDWKRGGTNIGVYDTPTTFFSNTATFGDGRIPTHDYSEGALCDAREGQPNDQTAGVDAEFSHGVAWDMFKNVAGLAGWSADGSEGTDIFTHWQANNSTYYPSVEPFSHEHINLGDGNWQAGGSPHTSMSVVGHEFTHGMDHNFGTLSIFGPNVMSEGIADIGGVLTQIYKRDGGWINGASHVTDTGDLDDFTVFGEILSDATHHHGRRFLARPSLDGSSPNAYFDGIEDLEPHSSSGPIRRAFYYIMKGASAHDDWDAKTAWSSNTMLLPWGLPGLGVDKGSRLYFDTFFGCMDDSDFEQARTCASLLALELFGPDASTTVDNAFAGVNVGNRVSYPRAPSVFGEQEPNESNGVATPVDWDAAPDGFENLFKMTLVGSLSSSSDIDEYKFHAKCGRHIGAQISAITIGSIGLPTMRLFWLDPTRNVWVSEGDPSNPAANGTLSVDAQGFCSGTGEEQFILKVTSGSANGVGPYTISMDAQ